MAVSIGDRLCHATWLRKWMCQRQREAFVVARMRVYVRSILSQLGSTRLSWDRPVSAGIDPSQLGWTCLSWDRPVSAGINMSQLGSTCLAS